MFKLFLFTLISVVSVAAHAVTPEEILSGFDLNSKFSRTPLGYLSLTESLSDTRYQVGAEWGKKPVTEADLNGNALFRRMAMATARIRSGGTGFFLGKYNGRYVIATNHHVCPSARECSMEGAVHFPLVRNMKKSQIEFYGSWPEIDLALFAIGMDKSEDATELLPLASPFAFNEDLFHGQRLLTIGFGVANNPRRVMVANQDSDCLVYSGDKEYRLMGDPDKLNPGPYKAWSFSNGCDVSHGDSGSAMMDRDSGRVMGIIWTGKIPKDSKIQNVEYMQKLFNQPTEEIWEQLSYGVPAVEMKKYLQSQLDQGKVSQEHTKTIQAVIQGAIEYN